MTRFFSLTVVSLFWIFPAPVQSPDLTSFRWLAGCWQDVTEERVVEEQWMGPRGGSMVGAGRSVGKGKMPFVEFLEIRSLDSGVYYIARPGGGRPVPFKLVSSSDRELVFENPAHDFPQRILYQRTSAEGMKARVEGMVNGKIMGQDFNFRRGSCASE
ncbi:MAG: hypothetical protein HYW57_05135 [Ignavibacteriales bacterium]|nr:hypothetical protein [Ignavibacteriales bacterium]